MSPTRPDDRPSPGSTRIAAVQARPVTLADGRAWGLARPAPRYRPEVIPDRDAQGRPVEVIRLVARVGHPAAIERLVADLGAACRAPRGPVADARRYEALMALAVALLRRAHDLEPDVAAALLDLDDVGLAALVDVVLALAGGLPFPLDPEPAPSARGGGDA